MIKRDKNCKMKIKSVYDMFKIGNVEFIVQIGICMDVSSIDAVRMADFETNNIYVHSSFFPIT